MGWGAGVTRPDCRRHQVWSKEAQKRRIHFGWWWLSLPELPEGDGRRQRQWQCWESLWPGSSHLRYSTWQMAAFCYKIVEHFVNKEFGVIVIMEISPSRKYSQKRNNKLKLSHHDLRALLLNGARTWWKQMQHQVVIHFISCPITHFLCCWHCGASWGGI